MEVDVTGIKLKIKKEKDFKELSMEYIDWLKPLKGVQYWLKSNDTKRQQVKAAERQYL